MRGKNDDDLILMNNTRIFYFETDHAQNATDWYRPSSIVTAIINDMLITPKSRAQSAFYLLKLFLFIISLFVPSGGSLFDITGTEYQFQTITCDSNEACTIICDVNFGCKGTTIVCPMHSECSINCINRDSCSAAKVTCPVDATCTISCTGSWSCYNIKITPPTESKFFNLSWSGFGSMVNVTYPIYPVDDQKNLSLICDEYGQCDQMKILCPTNAYCNILCIGRESCIYMNINWAITPGLGNLICGGESKACYGINFPIPAPNKPYTVQCSDVWECREAIINCPANALCDITCGGSGVAQCELATINCPVNGDCNVFCIDYGACINANILWSNKSTSIGSLYCSGQDACYNVIQPPTFAPSPNPTGSPIPSYPPSNLPSPAPTTPTNIPTFDPTTDPSIDPTADPTIYPTSPTVHPTTDPIVDPTVNPTVHPTTNPTVDPNANPTIDPTITPTVYPITDPTVDPTTNPTIDPTINPTVYPITDPTVDPTGDPTIDPTIDPTSDPTTNPTAYPTADPTVAPTTVYPTTNPTVYPTTDPTVDPTTKIKRTIDPTIDSTTHPTHNPSLGPTDVPSIDPTPATSNLHSITLNMLVADSDDSSIKDPEPNGILSIVTIILLCVMAMIVLGVIFYWRNRRQYHPIPIYNNDVPAHRVM